MKENPIKSITKIRILSPEHSEYVQKLAFESGFGWTTNGDTISHTDAPFLYFFGDGDIAEGYDDSIFDAHSFDEVSAPLPEIPKEIMDELHDFSRETRKINSAILVEKVGQKHDNGKPRYDLMPVHAEAAVVDVYRVCDMFEINDASGAIQHAIKKLLYSGQRGVKDCRKDLEEARDSIQRKLDIMAEDGK